MASPTNQFYLKLRPSTVYNFIIDWGDGSIETYNKTTPSIENQAILAHTYPSPNVYDIKISERSIGGFPQIYNNGTTFTGVSSDDVKLISVISWGSNQWGSSFNDSFEGCTNLSSIPATNNDSNFDNTEDFSTAWWNCSTLSTINLNLPVASVFNSTWYGCTNLKSFNLTADGGGSDFFYTWQNCKSLTDFNSRNLYAPRANNFTYAWENCTSLSSVNLHLSAATIFWNAWNNNTALKSFYLTAVGGGANDFSQTWYNCTSLRNFNNSNLNVPMANNFNAAWFNCTSLSSFNLTLSSANNFTQAWRGNLNLKSFILTAIAASNFSFAWLGCTSLTDFNNNLHAPAATSFGYAWYDCPSISSFNLTLSSATDFTQAWFNNSSLKSFQLSAPNATNFTGAWEHCTSLSLSGFPSNILNKMNAGANCFLNVKLRTSSYSAILTSLCANNFNNSVTFHAGNSLYSGSLAVSAKSFLTKTIASGGRGWNIIDGGLDLSSNPTVLTINTNIQ
jgi:hypothetical protein